jgi:ubiquinone/menaquinone biosynthesis C-methylase UbiE/uncharacterized protein YbaR (Trm112 family)
MAQFGCRSAVDGPAGGAAREGRTRGVGPADRCYIQVMFAVDALPLLSCSACSAASLRYRVFSGNEPDSVEEAVVWCDTCRAWFPLEDGVLDLLTGELAYRDDRARFFERNQAAMRELHLGDDSSGGDRGMDLQAKQQQHFDWYAENDVQSYLEYEQMPFWRAVDDITFGEWRKQIRPGSWLLDVGCGNGRSTFQLGELDINVVAFDVSKGAVRQAEMRARESTCRARTSFVAADATRFPLRDEVMDYVLIYGVLHHLPDPRAACLELARVLKAGGTYFGSENNHTIFRAVFDLMQKMKPLWYEEAGPEALISKRTITEAFAPTGVSVATRTSVFVPPHLVNLMPRWSTGMLRAFDSVFSAVPILRDNGGLILIEGVKGQAD